MEQRIDLLDTSEKEKEIIKTVNKVAGHLFDTEIVALFRFAAHLPDNSNILEIGSYRGKSSNAIGHAIYNTTKTLYCLDIWKNYETQPTGPLQTDRNNYQIHNSDFDILKDFLHNTDWFNNNVRVLKGSTSEYSNFLPENFFDLIFIDAAHDYENVCNDIDVALKSLSPKGILCGHDYHPDAQGVVNAVKEKIENHDKIDVFIILPQTSIWAATFKTE